MGDITSLDKISNPFQGQQPGPAGGALARGNEQRAVAEVQAAVMMAKRFPRDQVQATDRILNAFTRPTLAEVSQYQYSKGGTDVSGPSIRSAEAIAQQWGNIDFGFREFARGIGPDGVSFSEVEAYAWDMESIARKALQFIVRHWRDAKRGGYPIKDERDIYELVANQAQRRVRACLLSVIPGDVVEAAMHQADMTLRAKADTSPEGIKKLLETFAGFGVTKEMIEKRIQRRIDSIQPAQVVGLKKIYISLRDGMSDVSDWFDAATESDGDSTVSMAELAKRNAPQGGAAPTQQAAVPPAAPAESKEPEGAGSTQGGSGETGAEGTASTDSTAQPSSGPTLEDALALVEKGDIEGAQDAASGLKEDEQQQVYAAIGKAKRTKPRGGMSMD